LSLHPLGISQNKFSDNTVSKRYSFFSFRPLIRLNYKLSKASTFSGYYKANPNIPSLSELSLNQFYLDNYIVYRGNSDLHPYNGNIFSIKYSLNKKHFFVTTQLNYTYSKKPIQGEFQYSSGDYILLSPDNQGWERQLTLSSYLSYHPFKSHWMQLTFYGAVNRYLNKLVSGDINSLNSYEVYSTADFSYKDFTLSLMVLNDYKQLASQTIVSHPFVTHASIKYKHKNLTFSAEIYNPLSKSLHYASRSVANSIVYDNSLTDIYDNGRMFYIKLTYNLSFGKHFKKTKKKINNKDTDTGFFKVN